MAELAVEVPPKEDCLPVPTLELTCHLRALPAPGPLRVRQRVRLAAADRVDEESDVRGRDRGAGRVRVPTGRRPAA